MVILLVHYCVVRWSVEERECLSAQADADNIPRLENSSHPTPRFCTVFVLSAPSVHLIIMILSMSCLNVFLLSFVNTVCQTITLK